MYLEGGDDGIAIDQGIQMMKFKLITGVGLLLLVVIFTLQNTAIVDIWFIFWRFSISRALLFFLVLFIGVFLGWFLCTMVRNSKTRRNKAE